MNRLVVLIALTWIGILPVSAVEKIATSPLDQAIKTSVADCRATNMLEIPIITWGGDIATVHANGDRADTAAGSTFDKQGLKVKLVREDVFSKQIDAYLACRTPFLRGTIGMIGQAMEVADRDPRTKMVVVYQLTWSAGGDAMVVKGNIRRPADLKGKTIALQAYGPHIDYLAKVLSDSGLSLKDVKLRWVRDLTGTKETPRDAFYEGDTDAAMVITPDALSLTSGGTVGSGSEDSVKGAHILLTTKTANRVIADVYAVRSDYLKANRDKVQKFVHGLMIANELTADLFKNNSTNEYRSMISGAAKLLLDSADAVQDTEGLYGDAAFVGWRGNVAFFGEAKNPRGFENLGREVDAALIGFRLRSKTLPYAHARWDYNALKADLRDTSGVEAPRFDSIALSQVVTKRTQQPEATIEGQLFNFEVNFKPNQNAFSGTEYAVLFEKAINLAATYGGAVITVEGHADPLAYLNKKKANESEVVLGRIRQSAKNLSLTRANAVRDSMIQYAKDKGIALDVSQFAVVGHGIGKPKTGMCGSDLCSPKSEAEWLSNMRVEFRLIQIEAEESVFKPQ